MDLDLEGVVNPVELEKMATRFRDNLGEQLSEELQHRLNDTLGPDMRVGVRVVVESVSVRKPTS